MNLLVIKTTSLGDVLHGTTALPQLARAHPGCRITWLVDRGAAPLVRHHPLVHRVIESDFLGWEKRFFRHPLSVLREVGRLIRALRDTKYHVVYDLQGLFRTVVLLALSRGTEKWVKGKWLFFKGFGDKKNLHAVEEIRRVLEVSGIATFRAPMALYGGAKRPSPPKKKLKKRVLLSPFTGWSSKTWPLGRWGELLNHAPKDWEIWFTGAASDRAAVETLLSTSKRPHTRNALGELSLPDFADAVRASDLVITGEGFPAHVASAVETPVLILMGPTSEWRIGPTGKRFTLLRPDGCRPCYNRHCGHGCLGRVGAKEVIRESLKLLVKSAPCEKPWLPKLTARPLSL